MSHNLSVTTNTGVLAAIILKMAEKTLESLLGGKIDPQKLSQLPPGVVLTRLLGTDSPVEIQAWKS